jgi:hypothetical protein
MNARKVPLSRDSSPRPDQQLLPDHGVGPVPGCRLPGDVGLDHVTGRHHGGVAVQHHVRGTWLVAQQAENLLGLLCLANHPEVQHGFTP